MCNFSSLWLSIFKKKLKKSKVQRKLKRIKIMKFLINIYDQHVNLINIFQLSAIMSEFKNLDMLKSVRNLICIFLISTKNRYVRIYKLKFQNKILLYKRPTLFKFAVCSHFLLFEFGLNGVYRISWHTFVSLGIYHHHPLILLK